MTQNSIRSRATIRRATFADLQAVRLWLEAENVAGIDGNFLCNLQVIERSYEDGGLLVYIHRITGQPVAFQLGGLLQPGILQVRNEFRHQGIGKAMVEHCIRCASRTNQCLLYIECKPSSSIPFWQSMGFTLLKSNHAYRILPKKHDLPANGNHVDVVIRFFPERRKWEDETPAISSARPTAKKGADGTIYLAERVALHRKAYPDDDLRDPVVEIEVNKQRQYLDKAKYDTAQSFGVKGCSNGFYLDAIQPSTL